MKIDHLINGNSMNFSRFFQRILEYLTSHTGVYD